MKQFKKNVNSDEHFKKKAKIQIRNPLMIGITFAILVVFVCSNMSYTKISGKDSLLIKSGIKQEGETSDKTHFHVVESIDEFKQDAHYIIVAYNKKENKFYGLSPNSDGYQVELPFSTIDELKNGMDVDNDKIKTENYIFTCSSAGTKETTSRISGTDRKSVV